MSERTALVVLSLERHARCVSLPLGGEIVEWRYPGVPSAEDRSISGGRMPTVKFPAGPAAPAIVQGLQLLANRYDRARRWRDRYGRTFTVRLPRFGTAVMISDPADVKTVFAA